MTLREWCFLNNRQDILDRWSTENNITPADINYGSAKKVLWQCQLGHIWEASPNKVTQRSSVGCPYCSNQKVLKGFNDLQTKKPNIAAEWHPAKNGSLQPFEVTEHSNKSVWWLCQNGHEYRTKICTRTRLSRKGGCPYCASKRLLRGFNDLETVCPEVASEWHPTKNGNLKPSDVLSSASQVVWWVCPNGHEYQASLNSRVVNGKQRNGCPICSSKIVLKGYNDLESQYPEIAKEWDVQKNQGILPSKVLFGSHQKYWWICPFGHSYKASPENRTRGKGTGCPHCAKEQQSSFPEQAIFFYLKKQYPNAENRTLLFGKEIDVYIPEINTGIEYDGYRWHNEKTREKEQEKDTFFANKGIRIIRVKEYKSQKEKTTSHNTIWINGCKNQFKNIEYVIKEISKLMKFEFKGCINLERDNIEILKMFISSKKEASLSALRPDIAKDWNLSRNGTLSPEMVSVKSGKKVWWTCSKGHEYQTTIISRTDRNAGCPYCAGQKILKGFNDLQTRYPEIAKEWHSTKNGRLKPYEVMPGSRMKVWWICKNNHEYFTSISSRTNRKSGCPYCSGLKAISGETDLKSLFPKIACEWDYEKNALLKPEYFKPYSTKKVWWICPKGHSYETAIRNRTLNNEKSSGNGCPYCSGHKVLKGFNDLETLFPEIASKWHPTLNTDLAPEMVRPYSTKIVWWIDNKGNAYQRRIDSEVSIFLKNHKK